MNANSMRKPQEKKTRAVQKRATRKVKRSTKEPRAHQTLPLALTDSNPPQVQSAHYSLLTSNSPSPHILRQSISSSLSPRLISESSMLPLFFCEAQLLVLLESASFKLWLRPNCDSFRSTFPALFPFVNFLTLRIRLMPSPTGSL